MNVELRSLNSIMEGIEGVCQAQPAALVCKPLDSSVPAPKHSAGGPRVAGFCGIVGIGHSRLGWELEPVRQLRDRRKCVTATVC